MRRFIYTPSVEAFIRSDEADTIYDVSKDIVSGSVTRRLDAVSSASLMLQNKFGKYTRKIKPMDRIAIFMRRIGPPILIFTGYVDEAPLFQMKPGLVTINASCTLKLLQNTYFDPGLPIMTQFFNKFGWAYDASSGTITDPFQGFGNLDSSNNIAHLIAEVLIEVGGWPSSHIKIRTIPGSFKNTMRKMMLTEARLAKAEYEKFLTRVEKMLGVGLEQLLGPTSTSGGAPQTGNVEDVKVAEYAFKAGFRGEALVTAVAIAWAESSLRSDAVLWDTNYTFDLGLWQINTVNLAVPSSLPPPPVSSGDQRDIQHLPSAVQTVLRTMFSPQANANKAYAVSSSGTNFQPWSTYRYSPYPYKDYLGRAGTAVQKYLQSGTATASSTDSSGTQNITDSHDRTDAGSTQYTFLYPIAAYSGFTHNVTPEGYFGNVRPDGHKHAGVDISAKQGAALLACVDGTITTSVQSGIGGGNIITLTKSGSSLSYNYMHCDQVYVKSGQRVTQGTTIGTVGHSGTSNGFNHLHFEKHPNGGFYYETAVDPDPELKAAWNAGDKKTSGTVGIAGTAGTGATGASSDDIRTQQIARQAAWFTLTLPSVDTTTSVMLTGKRALANDIPLFEWIQNLVKASGRRFCSMPNGDFMAFFPDYFNYQGRTPYFRLRNIEIIDLTINMSDREMFTHVYGTGASFANQVSLMDRIGLLGTSMVASVLEPGFTMFINVPTTKGATKGRAPFDPMQFLERYGARPKVLDMPEIRNPILLWMAAWTEFCRLWANTFQASAEFTFMPELLPGGVVEFDNMITMFIEEVTHTFNLESGFSTSATLSAPAAINPKDNRFGSMVLATKDGLGANLPELQTSGSEITDAHDRTDAGSPTTKTPSKKLPVE